MRRSLALALALAAAALGGCAGYYIDSDVFSPGYTVEPEIVRDRVTIVWHRVTPKQLERLSSVFIPPTVAGRVGRQMQIGGMALPGPDGECHVFAPEVSRDPSGEARTLAHEVLHCFNGAYHTPEWLLYSGGITTWQGLSSPSISGYYLAFAIAAADGRALPEPPPVPEQAAAAGGCGE